MTVSYTIKQRLIRLCIKGIKHVKPKQYGKGKRF